MMGCSRFSLYFSSSTSLNAKHPSNGEKRRRDELSSPVPAGTAPADRAFNLRKRGWCELFVSRAPEKRDGFGLRKVAGRRPEAKPESGRKQGRIGRAGANSAKTKAVFPKLADPVGRGTRESH